VKFLFLGNQLALDFLNTRPVQDGEAQELLPDFGSLIDWFEAAGVLTKADSAAMRRRWAGSDRDAAAYADALRLREKWRREVLAWEGGAAVHGATLDELNRLMAEHPVRIHVRAEGKTVSKELWFRIKEPEDLLGPLAHSAASLFAEADRERVRKCGNCVLHFLDTSKKGTRRWCSMEFCGNRLKVAAYAARHRTK
jgi:predicted RNA-binding Zn ribbon-like protein